MSSEEENLPSNPIDLFRDWYHNYKIICSEINNSVMALATSDNNIPSVRMVLLKSFDDKGFVFYTNLHSNKGKALRSNKQASLLFFWKESLQQVRISGCVEYISNEVSDQYFKSRDRNSQLGAWASDQSSDLRSFAVLKDRFDVFAKKFEGVDVPRPDYWRGIRVIPNEIEFWKDREYRLHSRVLYKKAGDVWDTSFLYP